jgi:hypothetical protein
MAVRPTNAGSRSGIKSLSNGVVRDMESDNATQEDFDKEQDHQIKMEEEVGEVLIIVKTKLDELEKNQEDEKGEARDRNLANLLGIQQRAAATAREQDRLAAETTRDQDRLDRQQEMQAHKDLMEQLINALPRGAGQPAPAAAAANPAQNTKLPKRQIKQFKGEILEWTPFLEGYNVAVH